MQSPVGLGPRRSAPHRRHFTLLPSLVLVLALAGVLVAFPMRVAAVACARFDATLGPFDRNLEGDLLDTHVCPSLGSLVIVNHIKSF